MAYPDRETERAYQLKKYKERRIALNPDYKPRVPLSPEERSRKARERATEWYRNRVKHDRAGLRDEHNERRRRRWANEPEYREREKQRTALRRWSILPEERDEFLKLYEEDCFYCGDEGGTVDHLVPMSAGGESVLANFVPACRSCNSRKWALDLESFYRIGD